MGKHKHPQDSWTESCKAQGGQPQFKEGYNASLRSYDYSMPQVSCFANKGAKNERDLTVEVSPPSCEISQTNMQTS